MPRDYNIIQIDNLKSLVLNIQPHRLILSINVPYGFQFCKGSLLILLHWRMSVIVILNVRQIKEQFCFCNYVHDAFFIKFVCIKDLWTSNTL